MMSSTSFLAEAYYTGEVSTASTSRAYPLAQYAARFDDPRGLYIYGLCLYNGKGVSRDLVGAVKAFTSSAQAGDADATSRRRTVVPIDSQPLIRAVR